MTLELQQMPAIAPLMFKAAATARRRPSEQTVVPDLSARIADVRSVPRKLAAYRRVCGFADQGVLPVTWPQVLITPVHMRLMTSPGFPIPLLGMVHLHNLIEQQRELADDEALSFATEVGQLRRGKSGLELDIMTECRGARNAEPAWRSTMTVLHRIKSSKTKFSKPPGAPQNLVDSPHERPVAADGGAGRRYARVAGDFNPIHLHALSAKLFGFKRAIAHGMWTLARCCAELEQAIGETPSRVDVEFKRPLFLPGRATLKWDGPGEDGAYDYGLFGKSPSEVHLLGHLRTGLR